MADSRLADLLGKLGEATGDLCTGHAYETSGPTMRLLAQERHLGGSARWKSPALFQELEELKDERQVIFR